MKKFFIKSRIVYSIAVLLIGLVSCGFMMQSCSMDDDFVELSVTDNEKSLNLKAPNGEKIADNILHLKEIVSVSVSEKFGIDKDFNITSLEYYPVPDGYAVLIKYRTSDDIVGGLVQTNSNPILMSDKIIFAKNNIRLKTSNENSVIINTENNKKIVLTCISPPDSNCSCMPEITSDGIGCSTEPSTCDVNCTMSIRYLN
jgi:hypothetical protein